jgi:hypothetical protein
VIVGAEGVNTSAGGAVIVMDEVCGQLFASRTPTDIIPGPAPVKLSTEPTMAVVAPVVFTDTVKICTPVPPLAVKLPEPLVSPLHNNVIVGDDGVTTSAGGAVTVMDEVCKQLFASRTSTDIVPGPAPLKLSTEPTILVVPPVVFVVTVNV